MSKPVNLNRFRKQKARAEKRARADANAAKFGRRKDERAAQTAERMRHETQLNNHRLETGADATKDRSEDT